MVGFNEEIDSFFRRDRDQHDRYLQGIRIVRYLENQCAKAMKLQMKIQPSIGQMIQNITVSHQSVNDEGKLSMFESAMLEYQSAIMFMLKLQISQGEFMQATAKQHTVLLAQIAGDIHTVALGIDNTDEDEEEENYG